MALVENIQAEFKSIEHADAVGRVRQQAFDAFSKLGIPSVKHEEWRYTNVKTKLPETLSVLNSSAPTIPSYNSVTEFNTVKLVFVNGVFTPSLSQVNEQQGITITSLKQAFTTHNQLVEKHYGKLVYFNEEHFAALNTAFATDGAFIHIGKNTTAELPVLIVHLFTNGAESFNQTRTLVIAEQGSEIHLIEDFRNLASSAYYNHVSEIYIGANASVNITKLQTETANTTGIHTLEADLARDAKFTCTDISFDGALIRNNVNARLKGENAEAHLYGLYYGVGNSVLDNHILIDHIVPNCQSNQLYKGVLDNEASGVFNGKIFVKQDAQKTNAFQSSKAILLSNEASINSKPQLEIFADDVKCSHGAAIGQLGKNEVFYLRARGITERDAKAMLTYAFANDIIEKVSNPQIKEHLSTVLRNRLGLAE